MLLWLFAQLSNVMLKHWQLITNNIVFVFDRPTALRGFTPLRISSSDLLILNKSVKYQMKCSISINTNNSILCLNFIFKSYSSTSKCLKYRLRFPHNIFRFTSSLTTSNKWDSHCSEVIRKQYSHLRLYITRNPFLQLLLTFCFIPLPISNPSINHSDNSISISKPY